MSLYCGRNIASSVVIAGGIAAAAYADNSVLVGVERIDDAFDPSVAFLAIIEVDIPDVPGVTRVTLTLGDGSEALLDGSGSEWGVDGSFTSLAELQDAVHGTFTLTIDGASPSTTTFTFDANALAQGDFFSTPTNVFPPDGSSNVDPDVTFLWDDPTGGKTADAVVVFVEGASFDQGDNSAFGTMSITDTSWNPPLDLEGGDNEFAVTYVNFGDPDLVGPLTVESGSIVWSGSPIAPPGYPTTKPLLILGAETNVDFQVATCPGDFNGDGAVNVLDLLQMLGAWGSNPGNAADLVEDGVVNVLDLLALLGFWGAC